MRRNRVGKISTETLLVIAGVAVVGIYFLTRTTATPVASGGLLVTGPGGQTYLPGNTTAQDISAGAAGASSIVNSLNNAGIFG